MHNPELHALARIDWQLFCTFTFKSERKSDAIRQSMFFALLRTQAKVWKVHFKRLLWCLRRESGESTGRLHYHAIIAGLPPQAVTERNCLAVMSQWESFGGGMARVRAYDSSLDGLDYVLKGSGLWCASRWGDSMKTFSIIFILWCCCLTGFGQQPPASTVTFQNATTNVVAVNGTDYSGALFTLYLSPGQTVKQMFTGATFNDSPVGTWTQAQPTDGTEMQVLVCGPVTDAGPIFQTALVPPLVPDPMTIVEFWIWGVCTAIVLGLAGSMRRMLGRVHEVNTDL